MQVYSFERGIEVFGTRWLVTMPAHEYFIPAA
jgi:hypothetical protein